MAKTIDIVENGDVGCSLGARPRDGRGPLMSEATPPAVGSVRSLLREQLRKTPDERIRELVEMERFAEVLQRAAAKTTPG